MGDREDIAAKALLPPAPFVATASDTVTIRRPQDELFEYVADACHQREWNSAVKRMDQKTAGPVGLGTTYAGEIKRVGRVRIEIIAYDPPNLIIHRAHPSIAEVVHIWRFTKVGDGTRLDQDAAMRPRGLGWLLAPLIPAIVKKNTRECGLSLKLKTALESPH